MGGWILVWDISPSPPSPYPPSYTFQLSWIRSTGECERIGGMSGDKTDVQIRMATEEDVSSILAFIKALAAYEKRSHQVIADEASLRDTLFGKYAYAETLIAELNGEPAGFALFFHTYSTFLARPGIYLEDLFVKPEL